MSDELKLTPPQVLLHRLSVVLIPWLSSVQNVLFSPQQCTSSYFTRPTILVSLVLS